MSQAPAPPQQTPPPQNLEAEEYVLGALMLTASAIDRTIATGLEATDFYRESHGRIYRAAVSLHQLGQPVDPITVSERLQEQQQLQDVGGKERIREIATLVPAAANVAHHAQIVIREARRRQQMHVGELIAQRARESHDPDEIQAEALTLLDQIGGRTTNHEPLQGLTHQQVLQLELPQDRYLIEDLIPAGAVGTIAAVPEAHKSWLAQAIAVRVAAGHGWVLGRQVIHQGPVGYLWQDDSTREEAERVKAFEAAHEQHPDLPVTWYLNLGVQLPRDITRIRHAVEQQHLVLLILDSYYNFLPGIDLKDDQAEQIVTLLKREICDTTGCTVLIVDHMPWATDANRSRLRAYGGVFKNAATRFGIYIDVIGDKLHIEARGNNIQGISKRLAYWDADTLELKLLSDGTLDDDSSATSAKKIAEWVREQGGDVELRDALAYFEISDDTLSRRMRDLTKLGFTRTKARGPGNPSRLVAPPEPEDTDEQLSALDDNPANTPHRNEPHAEHSPDAEHFPHNQAKTKERTANTPHSDMRSIETPDLQGKQSTASSAPLKGRESPPAARRTHPTPEPTNGHRLTAPTLYIHAEGWALTQDDLATQLITRYHLTALELPDLLQLATTVALDHQPDDDAPGPTTPIHPTRGEGTDRDHHLTPT